MQSPRSRLLHVLRLAAAGLAVVLPLYLGSALANTFTVTKLADTSDGVCDADCSLREAIYIARSQGGGTILFAPALNGSTISLTLGDLDLDDNTDFTIQGPGSSLLTINSTPNDRIFVMGGNSGHFTLSGITLTNATGGGGVYIVNSATSHISDVVITNSTNGNGGGAINNNGGPMTVENSVFMGNTGGSGNGNGGGAIFNKGTLTITDSQFNGNHAAVAGAIYNNGILILDRTTFSSNYTTSQVGGAISNDVGGVGWANPGNAAFHGRLRVTDSTFTANTTAGGHGGAIYNAFSNDVRVTSSTFDSNVAGVGCCGQGGAIHNDSAGMYVTNSTFVNNHASVAGGAFRQFNGGSTIINSTFVGNSVTNAAGGGGLYNFGGGVTLKNSVVAGNTKEAATPNDLEGPFNVSYSVIGDAASAGGAVNNVNGNKVGYPVGSVVNTALSDSGGSTETLALVPGGPAIDMGSNALALDALGDPLLYDQRGEPYDRYINGVTDMGAYEFGAFAVPPLDHYLAYAAKLSRSSRFQPRDVQVADVFQGTGQVEEEASIFRVEKPVLLGNPVDKNSEGVYSEDLHLVAYKVARISGETDFAEGVLVENQFGSLTVDVRQDPDLLMLPSTKSLSGDAPEDEAMFGGDRHFLCYPIEMQAINDLSVFLDDQFLTDAASYSVTKAKRLCAPVEKTVVDSEGTPQGETVGDAEGDEYLMCYVVQKGQRGRPTVRQPRVDNQFGPLRLITSRETMLCVPSAVTLPG